MGNSAKTAPITTFLINDREDNNGFHMDWEAIKEGAHKWIGVPGILSCDSEKCTHTDGDTLQEAQRLSRDHKVTEITDVQLDESTHTAYAVHNVTSSEFADRLCREEIENVSQSVWLDNGQVPPVHVRSGMGYTPVHLAFLLNIPPAYGPGAKVTDKTAACNNLFSVQSASNVMEDPPKNEEKNQMSMADEIHEIHSMLKTMTAHSEEQKPEPKKEENPQSQAKGRVYQFNPPQDPKPESAMLNDLVS